MGLDVSLIAVKPTEVYNSNITHNLGRMASKAGIYEYLWRPEEVDIMYAWQLIAPLEEGLKNLKTNPEKFKAFDSPNGWGTYDDFVPFVEKYLEACKENPYAEVHADR